MYEVRLRNGTCIYTSEIFRVADEYHERLPANRDPAEPEVFTGMVHHIHAELFSGDRRPDLNDLQGLDNIWTAYTQLCASSKQIPTMIEFASLIGCDRTTFQKWENGTIRGNDADRISTVKRWKTMCEAGLARKTIAANSIGAIFALKSNYGWKEAVATPEEPIQQIEQASVAEIMARHADAVLPQKPELD